MFFQDYPQYWQLGLQEPATHIMEQMIQFHNFINFHITYIGVAVCFLLFIIIVRFNSKNYKKNKIEQFTHNSPLEIIWTLIPAFVLVILAVPSFKLLYIIEETFNPSTILKVVGHQWYWSYEYKSSDSIFQPLASRYNQIISDFESNFDLDSDSFFEENDSLLNSTEIISEIIVSALPVLTEEISVNNVISEGESPVLIEEVKTSESLEVAQPEEVKVVVEFISETVVADIVENSNEENNDSKEEDESDLDSDILADDIIIIDETEELDDVNDEEFLEDIEEESSDEHFDLTNFIASHDLSVSAISKIIGSENNIYNDYKIDSYMIANDSLDIDAGDLRLLSTDNHVVLPIHEEIKVLLTSADVLHSWAVPSFGIKVDACPGRLTQVPLTIKREGIFYGQCSEICGVNHGFMPITVRTHAVSL